MINLTTLPIQILLALFSLLIAAFVKGLLSERAEAVSLWLVKYIGYFLPKEIRDERVEEWQSIIIGVKGDHWKVLHATCLIRPAILEYVEILRERRALVNKIIVFNYANGIAGVSGAIFVLTIMGKPTPIQIWMSWIVLIFSLVSITTTYFLGRRYARRHKT